MRLHLLPKLDKVEKIIISRPVVESGNSIGFLPGLAKDKLQPYTKPIYDIMGSCLSAEQLNKYVEDGKIETVPFGYMGGLNFYESFVILDEVQNCSYDQLVLALTRFARGSKMVLTGDLVQSDLPINQRGGFSTIIEKLTNTQDIGTIKLTNADVIREKIVRVILEKLDDKKY